MESEDTKPQATEAYQKHIYLEVVKIRKWVVFFGVMVIIALIIKVLEFMGTAIDLAASTGF